MAKYRRDSEVVDAEQFFPTKKPWPEGVEQYTEEKTESAEGTTNEWYAWRVTDADGTFLSEIQPGDWIITRADGGRSMCRGNVFEVAYEYIGENK